MCARGERRASQNERYVEVQLLQRHGMERCVRDAEERNGGERCVIGVTSWCGPVL